MRKLLILTTLIFFTSAVTASNFSVQQIDQSTLDKAENRFNSFDNFPEFLSSLVGDQTVNVHLSSESANRTIGIDMEGMRINSTEIGGYNDPTLEVWIEKSDLNDISHAGNPIKEFSSKLESGEISYQSYGTVNSAKFFIMEKLISIASLF